jgi:hypothetical protein
LVLSKLISTTHIGNLLHVANHLIVALSLLTEPGEEGFAANGSIIDRGGGARHLEVPFALEVKVMSAKVLSLAQFGDEVGQRNSWNSREEAGNETYIASHDDGHSKGMVEIKKWLRRWFVRMSEVGGIKRGCDDGDQRKR